MLLLFVIPLANCSWIALNLSRKINYLKNHSCLFSQHKARMTTAIMMMASITPKMMKTENKKYEMILQ